MNNHLQEIFNKVAVAYFNVLSRKFHRVTEENHRNLSKNIWSVQRLTTFIQHNE